MEVYAQPSLAESYRGQQKQMGEAVASMPANVIIEDKENVVPLATPLEGMPYQSAEGTTKAEALTGAKSRTVLADVTRKYVSEEDASIIDLSSVSLKQRNLSILSQMRPATNTAAAAGRLRHMR